MKKLTKTLCCTAVAAAALFAGATNAQAASYSFQPNPVDLYDLDHYYNYTWGISWSIPANQTITGATLFFDNIRDWTVESNVIYVHMLNTSTTGVTSSFDDQSGGDNFAGQGVKLFEWHDLPATAQDLTYTFTASQLTSLTSYAADGKFGFGFDPDCHYFNDGITLCITTTTNSTPVPLPPAAWTGIACLGLGALSRARKMIKGA